MENSGPEPISEILSRLFAARGWGRQQERLQLEQAWRDAVGSEYHKTTRVSGYRRNILEVEVNGAIIHQELTQFHKKRIINKLRELLKGTKITDVRFRSTTFE